MGAAQQHDLESPSPYFFGGELNRFIVTTTINAPTEAVRAFDTLQDWNLIVIGDLKTPDYQLERGRYVGPQEQEAYDKPLSDAIGWNCIQRRNIGIAMAYESGADVVALVDDDNIPLPGWGEDLLIGQEVEANIYETNLLAFDPIGATNYKHLWHRGYPLQLLSRREYGKRRRGTVLVDVQADFWNGDPDVDAICRMEHSPDCRFDPELFPISSNAYAPFNSQNTFVSRRVLPHYFLYPCIGRMDDIWAAYYVQALGFRPVFSQPSVYQLRNEHDLTRDFSSEVLGYEQTLSLISDLRSDPASIQKYLPSIASWAWTLYRRHFAS